MRTTKLFIVFALVTFSTIHAIAQKSSKDVERYVERYRGLAMSEQQRTGIPAAIKLAQGIHETGAGTSKLVTEANNHFGLKCKSNWTGQTIMHTDDRRNECFRKYNLDFESYQDHSNYLAANPRYAELFSISVTDYAGWAFGLRKAGYATNPQYAQMLIKLIEDYKLQEYTYAAMASNNSIANNNTNQENNNAYQQQRQQPVQTQQRTSSWQSNRGTEPTNNGGYTKNIDNTPPTRVSKYIDTKPNDRQTVVRTNRNGRAVEQRVDDAPNTIVKINNLKAVYGKRGDMPLQYAVRNGIRYEKFLEMNDLEDKPLPADMPLYLERKHFWGIRPMHLVKPYETLIQIAQQEGIQLKYLRDLNYLEPDEEPVPGSTLELQAQAGQKPQVVKRQAEPAYTPNTQQQEERYADNQPEPPTSTFPKNPAPPFEEEPNIFEKIKLAREARKREKEEQSAQNITQNRPEPSTSAPQYNAPQQQRPVVQQPVQQRPVAQQPVQPRQTTQQPVQSSYSRQEYSYQNRNVTPNPAATVTTTDRKSRRERRKEQENPNANTAPQVAQQPVQQQQPSSELDKLKAQFDNVIYADNTPANNKRQPVQQYQQPAQQQPVYQQQRQPQQNTQYRQQQASYQQQNTQQYQQPDNQYNSQYVEGGDENTDVDNQPQYNDPSKFYTVKPGDTAYTIAKKHGITIRQLMEMNDLDFDQIKEGANLRVKQ